MKLFSESTDSLLVECENCKRVLKIPRTHCEPFRGGYNFKPPVLCKCGLQGYGINSEMKDIYPIHKPEEKEAKPTDICPRCGGEMVRDRCDPNSNGEFVIAHRCKNYTECKFIEYFCDDCGSLMNVYEHEGDWEGDPYLIMQWRCLNPKCGKKVDFSSLK